MISSSVVTAMAPVPLNQLVKGLDARLVDEIRKFVSTEQERVASDLAAKWEQGRILVFIESQPELLVADDGQPVDYLSILCRAVRHTVGYVLKSRRLFLAFRRRRDRDRLLKTRLKSGHPLTWRHVERLLPLLDNKDRSRFDMYLKMAVDNSWSSRELALRLKQDRIGCQARTGKGRPHRMPATLEGRLQKFLQDAQSLQRYARMLTSSDGVNFLTGLNPLTEDDIVTQSPSLLESIETAIVSANDISCLCASFLQELQLVQEAIHSQLREWAQRTAQIELQQLRCLSLTGVDSDVAYLDSIRQKLRNRNQAAVS